MAGVCSGGVRRKAGCNVSGSGCVWCVAAGSELGAEGMVTLAPALGKLVSLTSLDVRGT